VQVEALRWVDPPTPPSKESHKNVLRGEIGDFHGGEVSSRGLLGCDAVHLQGEVKKEAEARSLETLVSYHTMYTVLQHRRPRLENVRDLRSFGISSKTEQEEEEEEEEE
jgi:hypothetical protein